MKKILMMCAILALSGCSLFEDKDPVVTGQIIGFTYKLTQENLKDKDRENIEQAYKVFTEIVSYDEEYFVKEIDIQTKTLELLEENIQDPERRALAMAILTMYWDRIDEKYQISLKVPKEQIAILKQVRLGIEEGLGR